MATKLEKTIKREIEMDGTAYMVTISPEGVKLTQKGFRKGREMSWRQLWSGGTEEGLVEGLNAPYSDLLTPKELQGFTRTPGGRYGGVGMLIEDQNGRITI